MKKLLLLISLLLATNAWAEVKTLKCEINQHEYRGQPAPEVPKQIMEIAYDLELSRAEVTHSSITEEEETKLEYFPVLLVTPTKLSFKGSTPGIGGGNWDREVIVNRQDLGITVRSKQNYATSYTWTSFGTCQIDRTKKNRI